MDNRSIDPPYCLENNNAYEKEIYVKHNNDWMITITSCGTTWNHTELYDTERGIFIENLSSQHGQE